MMKMSGMTVVEEVLEELGLIEQWEARLQEKIRKKIQAEVREKVQAEVRERVQAEVREENQRESVRKLQKHGMEPRQIAEVLELPLGRVSRYLKTS
jgi:hypothetical protein